MLKGLCIRVHMLKGLLYEGSHVGGRSEDIKGVIILGSHVPRDHIKRRYSIRVNME